jgi:hypothetical protein
MVSKIAFLPEEKKKNNPNPKTKTKYASMIKNPLARKEKNKHKEKKEWYQR